LIKLKLETLSISKKLSILQVAETQKEMLINNDGHITATNIKLASVVQESTIYPSPPFLKTNYDCKYVSLKRVYTKGGIPPSWPSEQPSLGLLTVKGQE
jgi:hypothetical protein